MVFRLGLEEMSMALAFGVFWYFTFKIFNFLLSKWSTEGQLNWIGLQGHGACSLSYLPPLFSTGML